jgi:hypothetical protein
MKNRLFLYVSFCLFAAFGIMSCVEGPEGPEGPQGPAGANGINGAENCIDCHGSSQLITAKLFQWENSIHATGGHYERNDASCAKCHTSQGFLEYNETGTVAGAVDNPLPQNCYTCHQIHNTYTGDDWALTSGEPVTLDVGGATVDLGKGNQCINCHQARVPSPALPTPGDTEIINLTNKRYGPHHGAQGMAYTGNGAFEIGEGYSNSAHTALVPDACITCHMATVEGGRETGGHTFRVISEDGEVNMNGCAVCHTDGDELEGLIVSVQDEIQGLLDELGTKLNELGLLDDALEYAVTPQDMTATQVGIIWNYQYVKEDKSLGVHNYQYIKTLLENSIAAL